jgi:hypothetical protein
MYFQKLFYVFILFFFLSSVLIREGFENCDNLVYKVGENQQNLKKKNNINQLLGYTKNTHLYRILEFDLTEPMPVNANFFNNEY